jgi:hypothetical protein
MPRLPTTGVCPHGHARSCMPRDPRILELTDRDYLNDRYFTQTLLPDYVNEHPKTDDWDMVWDARGHFTEPHTGREIALGTLEVREYLGLRAERGDAIAVDRSVLYPTLGPEHRFNNICLSRLFASEHLAERYDLAITSSKGMSVTALRMLLDRLMARGIEQIFVLRDFDVSGFSIFGTLGISGRRYRFTNRIRLIDFGLRLVDVEAMALESEPALSSGDWNKRIRTLRRHGATAEEIAFLEDERVELNAMTRPQLIAFVEEKLTQHRIAKLVPDEDMLQQHARRLIEQQLAAAEVEKLRTKLSRAAARTPLPADLRQAVERRLAEEPQLPWDAALAELLGGE